MGLTTLKRANCDQCPREESAAARDFKQSWFPVTEVGPRRATQGTNLIFCSWRCMSEYAADMAHTEEIIDALISSTNSNR